MKEKIVLTEEQQKMVADNHNLIYKIIHSMKLSVDEYYDICAIGLCKSAITYNSEAEVQFSTYAYNVMKNEILCYMQYLSKKKRIPQSALLYYDEEKEQDDEKTSSLFSVLKSDNNTEEEAVCKVFVEGFITKVLKKRKNFERNKAMLKMIIEGYTAEEIGKKYEMSKQSVSKLKISFREYIKKEMEEE